jgi:hypothetical protein
MYQFLSLTPSLHLGKPPKELRKERTEPGQIWNSNVKRRIPRTMNHGQTAQCKATDWHIPWYSHFFFGWKYEDRFVHDN